MGYHAFKSGPSAYKKVSGRCDYQCFICDEPIPKGVQHFVEAHNLRACKTCMDEWKVAGGAFGSIPRSKSEYNNSNSGTT